MNKIYKISAFLLGAIFMLSLNSCDDNIEPEITEINVSRLFSPTDLKVRIQNQTEARLEWKGVNKATSYTLEFFENGDEDFSGTAYKVVSDIEIDKLPIVVKGFQGETKYSVRLKSIGDNIDDSNWITETFGTDKEQIVMPIPLEEVGSTEVIIRWTAGEVATKIVVTPGDISYTVTDSDIAAGKATVGGLTGETEYSAELFRNDKSRGTANFETLLDVSKSIQINPGDDFATIIGAANAGDVFAVMPGVYDIAGNVEISKSIRIVGALPYDKPVINGAVFRIKEEGGFNLKNLVLDGTTASDGNQAVVYDDDTEVLYPSALIENSEIKNYIKGIFYVSKKANIQSVTFKGNIIHDIECTGGDFIDFRNGLTATFLFENNTVYNSANTARDFFRMDAGGSTNFPSVKSIITIKNNTFYNVSNNNGKRFCYVRLADHEINLIKNIIAETAVLISNQSVTEVVEYSKNNYYNAPNFYTADDGGKNKVDNSGTYSLNDPGFTNPATGNFTISDEDLKFDGIGDPRWIN